MKYSRNRMGDVLTNNSKSVQTHTYTWIYKYFVSVWKRFSLVLKKINNKNWQMVREYAFIGISAILITAYCVLSLMYK